MASFTTYLRYSSAMSSPCSNLLGKNKIGAGSGDITHEWTPIRQSTVTV